MTVDKYKGKKLSVVFPQEVFQEIEELSEAETRSMSQMVVQLVKEALSSRKNKAK
jgi:metal-responsive CopG/Arc/MetJ family transcriptional regulator